MRDIDVYLEAIGTPALSTDSREKLAKVLPLVADRSKKLGDIMEKAHFVLGSRPFTPNEAADKLLDSVSRGILKSLTAALQHATWDLEGLEACLKDFSTANDLKLGKIAQPLRAALTGRTVSPSVFDMMAELGREETLGRLHDATMGTP